MGRHRPTLPNDLEACARTLCHDQAALFIILPLDILSLDIVARLHMDITMDATMHALDVTIVTPWASMFPLGHSPYQHVEGGMEAYLSGQPRKPCGPCDRAGDG